MKVDVDDCITVCAKGGVIRETFLEQHAKTFLSYPRNGTSYMYVFTGIPVSFKII